jgi:hypothetical protein
VDRPGVGDRAHVFVWHTDSGVRGAVIVEVRPVHHAPELVPGLGAVVDPGRVLGDQPTSRDPAPDGGLDHGDGSHIPLAREVAPANADREIQPVRAAEVSDRKRGPEGVAGGP